MPKQDPNQPAKIQLTKEGLEELKAELAELKEVKLPQVIERVAAARAHGDLSENAEYSAAKEDQSFTETRISEIEDVLERAEIVKQSKSKLKIGIGSKVTATQKGKKGQRVFEIVGEYEADPVSGKISAASPLGKALIGHKKSDTVKVETPGGVAEYEIVNIE